MEPICTGKGNVIEKNLMFGLFGLKTKGSCVYNETAQKQGNLAVSLQCDITYELME